ncbi:hypothetical protein [Plantactinospora veratri]
MPSWTVDGPRRLTLTEPVDQLVVRLNSGRVNVVGTDGPARIEVTRTDRRPLVVEHHDGRLSVRHRTFGGGRCCCAGSGWAADPRSRSGYRPGCGWTCGCTRVRWWCPGWPRRPRWR